MNTSAQDGYKWNYLYQCGFRNMILLISFGTLLNQETIRDFVNIVKNGGEKFDSLYHLVENSVAIKFGLTAAIHTILSLSIPLCKKF
jgi:hypothetical protein